MSNVKTDTIIRTIILALALVNQCLSNAGKSPLPIENEQVEIVISTVFTLGASLWAWWKNNSFTQNAIEADKVLDELRQGEK